MILTVTANAAVDKRYVVNDAKLNTVNRVLVCEQSAGGKGINVSRVARIAGEAVTATGFLGGDAGDYLRAEVEATGAAAAFVNCEGESRTCIHIWDEANKTQTEFLEPGITVKESDKELLLKTYSELLSDASVVTLCGSLPAGTDASLYRSMIQEGKKRGKKIILDTSEKTLADCLESKPYMIKPNIEELRMLTGRPITSTQELMDAAEELHHRGIPYIVVSLGADGALMCCEEGVFRARIPKVDVVNNVGCGDSMVAGFAVGFTRGLSPEECLRFASAVSVASAMRPETGFYVEEDAKMLLPQIVIEKLK